MPRPQPWLQRRRFLPSPFGNNFARRTKVKLSCFAHSHKYFSNEPFSRRRLPLSVCRSSPTAAVPPFPILGYITNKWRIRKYVQY
jgi:hypothetical protein